MTAFFLNTALGFSGRSAFDHRTAQAKRYLRSCVSVAGHFLAGANLLLVFQLISADEKTAGLLFHAMRHALFPVPVILLALSVLKSSIAIKEFMGLLAYTAKGYISFDRLVSDFKTVDF